MGILQASGERNRFATERDLIASRLMDGSG
jgi:hypothetical protein